MALEGDVGGNVVIRAHPDALLLYETSAAELRDVDTVEALFTSGIISMVADACRILSILAVIAVKNTGLALLLLLVLPLLANKLFGIVEVLLDTKISDSLANIIYYYVLFAIVLTITCINLLVSRKHVHY